MSYKKNQLKSEDLSNFDIDADIFGPSTYKEIDKKFQQLCSQNARKYHQDDFHDLNRGSLMKNPMDTVASTVKRTGNDGNTIEDDFRHDTKQTETGNKSEVNKTFQRAATK